MLITKTNYLNTFWDGKRFLLIALAIIVPLGGCSNIPSESDFQAEYENGLTFTDPELQLSYFSQMNAVTPKQRLQLMAATAYSALLARQNMSKATEMLFNEARRHKLYNLTPEQQVMACLGAPGIESCDQVSTSKIQELVSYHCHWNPDLKRSRDKNEIRVFELLAQSCAARISDDEALARHLTDSLPPYFSRDPNLQQLKQDAGLHYNLDDGLVAFEYLLEQKGIYLSQLHRK